MTSMDIAYWEFNQSVLPHPDGPPVDDVSGSVSARYVCSLRQLRDSEDPNPFMNSIYRLSMRHRTIDLTGVALCCTYVCLPCLLQKCKKGFGVE